MNVVFISALEYGYRCIKSVLEDGWDVSAIFTMEDELIEDASGYVPMDSLAEYGADVVKVEDINASDTISDIEDYEPDVIVVLGWSQIVGDEVIELSRLCSLGNHPTLLPKHRGRAPIPWSIIMGLTRSGTTFFHLVQEVDAGDIFAQKEFPITFQDDAESVYEKAVSASAELLSQEIFPKLNDGEVIRQTQDEKSASYWKKREPRDGLIDWDKRARNLYDWIRGLTHPYPGAFTYVPDLDDAKLTVWASEYDEELRDGDPGEVLDISSEGLLVGTGDGGLLLTRLQLGDGPEMDAEELVEKHGIAEGVVLG